MFPSDHPLEVYILLTQTGTGISRFLRFFSHDRYNHSSLALDNTLTNMVSFGRRVSWFPFISGMVYENYQGGLFARYRETVCKVYRLRLTPQQYESLHSLLGVMLREMPRYKYSLLGIPLVYFGIPFGRPYRFTCSEFVSTLLCRAGILQPHKPCPLFRPSDFENLPMLEPVYEGLLRDYSPGWQTAYGGLSAVHP